MIETSERFDNVIRVIAIYQATTVQRYLLYPQNGKIDSLKRDHWYRVSYHHLFHLSRNTLQICRVPIAELLVSVVHSAQIMSLKSDCSRQGTSMGILTRSDWNLISGTKAKHRISVHQICLELWVFTWRFWISFFVGRT